MPFVPTDKMDGPPTGPHLALRLDDGSSIPILEGNHLWIVEDATRVDSIFPLILKKVSHQALVFAMVDANGGVTEYKYQLVSGKPKNKAALDRMVKNGALKPRR